MNASELINYLFKDGSHPLVPRFIYRVNSSAKFRIFVDHDRNRNKIRGKITYLCHGEKLLKRPTLQRRRADISYQEWLHEYA